MATLSPQAYKRLSEARAQEARVLLQAAFADVLPKGYAINTDPEKMARNALLAICPALPAAGDRMVHFVHRLHYRMAPSANYEARHVIPTAEHLIAGASLFDGRVWKTDTTFGESGSLVTECFPGADMDALVRIIASQSLSYAPFVSLHWEKSPTDEFGRWDLFNRNSQVSCIWKSGPRYATLLGTSPRTLAEAQNEAEAAARAVIATHHQERLAGLGDVSLEDHCDPLVAPA